MAEFEIKTKRPGYDECPNCGELWYQELRIPRGGEQIIAAECKGCGFIYNRNSQNAADPNCKDLWRSEHAGRELETPVDPLPPLVKVLPPLVSEEADGLSYLMHKQGADQLCNEEKLRQLFGDYEHGALVGPKDVDLIVKFAQKCFLQLPAYRCMFDFLANFVKNFPGSNFEFAREFFKEMDGKGFRML